MYWDKEKQKLFIKCMEQGETPKNMALKFGKSITATRSKIARIKRTIEKMEEMGITRKILIDTVSECAGYMPEIKKRLSISSHVLMSFISCYPEINIKISNIRCDSMVIMKPKNRIRIRKNKIVKLNENIIPKERNYLEEAEQILQGRLTRHPKLGRLLDGNMASVKEILEAANIIDPAFYV